MKTGDIVVLSEAPFKAPNFPAEPNKKRFSAAGERTIYSEMPVNQKGGEGFRVLKDTKVVRGKGATATLKANTRIFWTMPAKLFRAEEVGEKGNTTYAMFGLKSAAQKDAVGMVAISAVSKPSQLKGRVLTGKAGQEAVYEYLRKTYGDKHTIEQLETAAIGSQRADLVVSIDATPYQFEIKNSSIPASKAPSPVTLFDRTVRRDKPNAIIDGLVSVMTGKARMTLAKMVDQLRKQDKTIGYPGDAGVGKSGKFMLRMDASNPLMGAIHTYIEEHLQESGDSYLAIYHIDRVVKLFYTGYGRNILKASELPIPKFIKLETYGGPYTGGMRMGVKVKF